jgi:dTDP-4-dehydrorhamnose reductase
MRVALIGSRGQLGAAMVRELSRGHDVVAFDRAMLDVTDGSSVERAIERVRPDVLVNCTGYNAVDAAEDHPVEAIAVNGLAVLSLARAARSFGAALVHFGSDFVFDGSSRVPYSEEDRPSPRSVYAVSKLLGEWFAEDAPRAYVLRVESLFGGVDPAALERGSVAAIVAGLRAGAVVKAFVDRTVSPTFVIDAARATRELIEREAAPGLYHCVNSGLCTWLEFAEEAARQLGVESRIEPVALADARLRAARPLFCALSNRKLHSVGIEMPSWQDALARYLAASEQ